MTHNYLIQRDSECKMCEELFSAIRQIIIDPKFLTWSNCSIPWFYRRTIDGLINICKSSKSGKLAIVGITGLAGSGKDTATNLAHRLEPCLKFFDKTGINEAPMPDTNISTTISKIRQFTTINLPFAAPLKKIAVNVGFTLQQVFDPKLKNEVDEFWGITPRQFLQMCGTEMFRKVWRDDVWVKVAEKQIKQLSETLVTDYGIIFVTDVRFPNEAQMIKDLGGHVIRINRPGVQMMNHASENQIKDLPVDAEFINDCSTGARWSVKFLVELVKHFNPQIYWQ